MSRPFGDSRTIRSRNRPARNPLPAESIVASSALPAGAATATKQDSEIAQLAALVAGLLLAQGADSTDATGPMVQAVVGATPPSFMPDAIRPASLTTDGRLRVATDEPSPWEDVTDSPWTGFAEQEAMVAHSSNPWT